MRRLICMVVLSAAALMAISGAANAAVRVLNPGTFTATSSNTVLSLTSIGATLTCSSSVIRDTVSATGTSSIAIGGAVYTGCNSTFLGGFTVTQTSVWTDAVLQTSTGVVVLFIIPRDGVRVTSTSTGLSFFLGGTIQTDLVPITVGALRSVASLTFTAAAGLSVTTSSVTGIPVGLRATYSGTYGVSPAIGVLLS